MFNPVRAVARGLMGTLFVAGGLNQVKDPVWPAAMTDTAKAKYGLTDLPDSKLLVRVNGAGMMAAGAALGLGYRPRTAALLLAGLLQPTNVVGHPFWTMEGQESFMHRNEFFANLAITGGLLLAVLDRD